MYFNVYAAMAKQIICLLSHQLRDSFKLSLHKLPKCSVSVLLHLLGPGHCLIQSLILLNCGYYAY